MAIDAFLGKWCLVSSEGFEDYMKELGKETGALRFGQGAWHPTARPGAAAEALSKVRGGNPGCGTAGSAPRSRHGHLFLVAVQMSEISS